VNTSTKDKSMIN